MLRAAVDEQHVRHGGELLEGRSLLAGEVLFLDVQAGQQVLDDAQDVLAQGFDIAFHLLDRRADGTGSSHQFLAAQNQFVVLADRLVGIGIIEAGIDRNHFERTGGTPHIISQVFGYRNACLELDNFRIVAAAFIEVAGGGFVHVHDALGTLESCQIVFHGPQFILDDNQTLIDESRRVHCDAVLLPNGIFVVFLNQYVKDIACALDIVILLGDRENIGVLLDLQAGQESLGGITGRHFLNFDLMTERGFLIVGSGLENSPATGQGDGVAQINHLRNTLEVKLDGLGINGCNNGAERPGLISFFPGEKDSHR